jgi:hypothetical protein
VRPPNDFNGSGNMASGRKGIHRKPDYSNVHRLTVFMTVLAYLASSVAWPLTMPLACVMPYAGAGAKACSCPMCTTDAGGVHHCDCCDHGEECECGLSARTDETGPAVFPEPAIAPMSQSLTPLLASRPILTVPAPLFADFGSNVPTPPPRA